MSPIVLLAAPSGVWQWSLVDVDGVEHSLNSGDDVVVLAGGSGMLMAPVAVRDRELPLRAGSALQGVRIRTRELDLPLLIDGMSMAATVDLHEQLLTWLDPTRGSVALRVTRPDGARRELFCTYSGGLEGDEAPDNGVDRWWSGVATFRAHEPYWQDVDATTRTYSLNELVGTWFPMTFPIQLANSQVFQLTAETNTGSAEVYPTWTLTGPGVDPVLRNLTTGKQLGLSPLTLLAGETLTIETAPLVAIPIRDGGGNSRFDTITLESERWPLIRGANSLQIEMTGATVASGVTMAYRRRWLRR